MRAAIYTRVSTDIQAEEGFSLDAQLDRLRSYCESQGWDIMGIYTDEGVSAKNTERPELQRMLSDIEAAKIDVVLVYKLDRLTRSVTDLYQLIQKFEQHHVGFKSATEVFDTTTAMGRLFITIVAALAQWERENLAERTKMGQIEMTKQGKWSGGKAAFGYDYVDGQLIINEAQAEVVCGIFARYLAGLGRRRILQWLNDPDCPQIASYKRWTLHAVNYVLQNPLYAGYVRYGHRNPHGTRQKNAIVEQGKHEAIVSPTDFERAQEIRKMRSREPGRSGTGTYPLSGVLRCGSCGSSMAGRTNYRRNKQDSQPRRYYACTERAHSGLCKMPMVPESIIEAKMLEDMERQFARFSNRTVAPEADKSDVKVQTLEAELSKAKAKRQRWLAAFNDGGISPTELRDGLDLVAEEELVIQRQLDQLAIKRPGLNQDFITDILQSFRASWEISDISSRREMLTTIVEKIIVHPDKKIRVVFRS